MIFVQLDNLFVSQNLTKTSHHKVTMKTSSLESQSPAPTSVDPTTDRDMSVAYAIIQTVGEPFSDLTLEYKNLRARVIQLNERAKVLLKGESPVMRYPEP